MEGFAHHGHYVWLDPEESGGKWEAQVVVEVHAKGQSERIYYHDHMNSYPTRNAALDASRDFGKRMVENFTVPAFGEGDYTPTLMLAAPQALQGVVFASASGGLLTLQRRLETGIGTFQFMAGREVGLTLWGYTGHTNQFIATPTADPASVNVINYKSLELDFPVLEYVPPRVFATTLSLAAVFQLGFGVEFPQQEANNASGAPYDLGTSWVVYLRFRLDARKYFGGSSD